MLKRLLFILLVYLIQSVNAQIPNTLSNTEKVYGLSKLWQEANYNFVYLNKIDREKWENDYKSLIAEVQETKNDYEYYRLLLKFYASLKDGHTDVFYPDYIIGHLSNSNFGEYRLFFSNFDNKAIVTRVNLSKKDEIPIGSEVIKVNGIDTKSFLEKEVIPYISSSTDYVLMDAAISNMFLAPKGTSFNVTFKLPDGKIKELTLTHTETTEKKVYPEFEEYKLFDFKWVDKDIAYISLNSFADNDIISLFLNKLPELYKAKKLIIDLRQNGGGNTNIALSIFQYLTTDTVLYGSKMQSRLHIPTYKAWGKMIEAKDTIGNKEATQAYLSYRDEYYYDFPYESDTISLNEKRLNIPTVILTGHNTASAAEDFLIYASNQQHMIKIGGRTFGSTGQPLSFELPGEGYARVCTKKDTYPDGKEFVGYGIIPDIEVSISIKDFLENKDPILEKAIYYLMQN